MSTPDFDEAPGVEDGTTAGTWGRRRVLSSFTRDTSFSAIRLHSDSS